MAVVVSNDNETGSIASYPDTAGSPAMVSPPNPQAYSGSFALECTIGADEAAETFTATANIYTRVAIRVDLTVNPSANTTLNFLGLHDAGYTLDMGAVYLLISTGGALSLQCYNGSTFQNVGSAFGISENTWYILELKNLSNGASGTLEMRVDGIVRATSTPQNVGVAPGMVRLKPVGTTNGATGTVYYDVLEVWDDAYPGVPVTITWEQEGYAWRRDDGTEVLGGVGATYIGSQDTPL